MRRIGVLVVLVALSTGCIPCRLRVDEQIRGVGLPKPIKDCVILIAGFEHPTYEKVRGSSLVVGWAGEDAMWGVESGERIVRGVVSGVPMWLVYALQDSGAFKGVITQGTKYDIVLTGRLRSSAWWHWSIWPQILDLFIHAWVLPTMPYCGEAVCELRLTDRSGRLLKSIKTTARRTYIATVWAALYFEEGYSVEQELEEEALHRALSKLTEQ